MKPVVLPGLLVEYLVVGSSALFWIMILVGTENLVGEKSVPALYIIAIAPSIYVLGMIVEFFALALVSFPPSINIKGYIRKKITYKLKLETDPKFTGSPIGASTARRQIELKLNSANLGCSELAEEVSIRSSRDRIARGTLMNGIIAVIVLYLAPENHLPWPGMRSELIVSMIFFSLFAFAMWVYFEASSYAYELRLTKILDERVSQLASD